MSEFAYYITEKIYTEIRDYIPGEGRRGKRGFAKLLNNMLPTLRSFGLVPRSFFENHYTAEYDWDKLSSIGLPVKVATFKYKYREISSPVGLA